MTKPPVHVSALLSGMQPLRPYQERTVESVFEAWRSSRRVLLVAPTGAGKTRLAEEFVARLTAYLQDHNAHRAHPYRWTYTGQPLVRATPFSQTRRQQRFGRAWFSARPQRFERFLYPLRPYRRHPTDNCSGNCKMAI